MKQHVILVLEGGGAKGPIHLGELEHVERALDCKLVDCIDLIAATSIGAVESSIYVTGSLSVDEIWRILEPNMKKIFTSQFFWSVPRYDWKKYLNLYEKHIGKFRFGESKIGFMFTTVDLVTGLSHFVKSWNPKYKNFSMARIVHRSMAAPFFFGAIYDSTEKAIWSDGGIGFFNLPLIEAYTQAVSNGWLENGHQTHILALGTGRKKYKLNFRKELKKGKLRRAVAEVRRFISKDSGGLARAVSASTQVKTIRKLADSTPALSFQWVDKFPLHKKLDKIDNWRARKEYYNMGVELAAEIDLEPFKRKLKESGGVQ